MKRISSKLTVSQFAKLHKVNKRTLHYYDSIGFFKPNTKADNGYRYYDISQSLDFEYIRMLKDLKMSIEEIEAYLINPTSENFFKMADYKLQEINMEMQRLADIKIVLETKKNNLTLCENLSQREIKVEELPTEYILIVPYDFQENDMSNLFFYLKDTWNIEQIRMGIGSIISLDKVLNMNFEKYDGYYIPALNPSPSNENSIKPKGKYLCGYQKGTWDKLPYLYKEMIDYAKQNALTLHGYAYEIGLNEFAITDSNEYVTKIMIKIEEES